MEKVALDADGTNYLKSVQYYNGLGYPTVSVGVVGGSGQTAYTLTTYDGVGREDCKYLPVSTDYSILYKDPSTIQANSKSSNGYNDAKVFSQTTYDALDRPLKVTTAGTAFANNPSKIEYSANDNNVVKRYEVSGDKLIQNSSCKFYPANSLTNEISTDPDGVKVETFKDFSGKVIMQRVNGNLCTYYVYDNLGLLRFVLPPKCTSADKDLVAAYGYRYRYDKRGRLITKTLPGCDSIKYWYDSRDRMICMRDPRLRAAGKYRFFIYDKFNRLVVQGVCTSCPTNATVRNAAFSSSENGVLGTSYVMPSDYVTALKNPQLELANYYDKNHNNIKGDKSAYFADIKNVTTSRSQQGLLTGTLVAASNGDFMAQVMVYDVKGNITNVKSRELGGKIVSNTNKYSHTGNLQSSTVSANVKYGSALKIEEKIGYNKYNNKKNADTITINHGTAATSIMSYTYNKLGQLATITRPLPSSVTRTVSYAYDMHGWLKTIKTNSFMEELFYADCPDKAYNRYNGNIGSMRWKDKTSSAKRGYKFTYDKANRMTAGVYGEGDNLTSNPNLFTESMTYDENGNVKTVKRYNKGSSGTSVLMDNLTITYNGNQPSSVAETVADNNTEGSFEYKKAKGSGYKFNTSGSLLADKSRGIAYITYDLNNNPEKIYFTNGSMTKYIYSASGQKLRAIHYTAKPNITKAWGSKPADLTAAQTLSVDSTDYLLGGSLVMTNGKIDKYLFEGGYAQATSTSKSADSFAFNYYNQDHLVNNREVVDAKGVVQQVTNYYPFGAPYADATASKGADVQPYKYNGKELDRMHGLNTYDYGARQHDPILARWDRIDPLCEEFYGVTPYAYCNNNPTNSIDPDGKIAINAIAGAIGAAVGAGVNAYIAYCEDKSANEIWGAAAEGAIVGGVTGLTLGANLGVGAAVAIGASSSAVGNATNQMVSKGKVDTGEVVNSTLVGGVAGGIGNAAGSYVNKLGRNVIKEIETKAANTVANARNIAYDQVKNSLNPGGEPVKMGGKYAKQQINKIAPQIAKEANASAASAKKTATTITKGKNWSVQMGIGNVASKVSDACSDMKKKVKSFIGNLF